MCVFVNKPLYVFVGVAESVASKAGSLTSHCDPDLKCSEERGGAPQKIKKGTKKRETEKGKADKRERGREGETNYENPTTEERA